MADKKRAAYARQFVIERAIAAARAAGVPIEAFEMDPTGRVRIITSKDGVEKSAYDVWKAKER